jgi:uncharacterized protein YndB with AHSA1/START domain
MTTANKSHFVYVTFIRTTPAKLWKALTEPQFIRQYWFNMTIECGWTKGSPWNMRFEDGSLADTGEILEIEAPRRMVIRWQNKFKPELAAEGASRCTIEVEPVDHAVKLTITHELEVERPDSKFITAVSGGWPLILSNLKSLLETGEVALLKHPGH